RLISVRNDFLPARTILFLHKNAPVLYKNAPRRRGNDSFHRTNDSFHRTNDSFPRTNDSFPRTNDLFVREDDLFRATMTSSSRPRPSPLQERPRSEAERIDRLHDRPRSRRNVLVLPAIVHVCSGKHSFVSRPAAERRKIGSISRGERSAPIGNDPFSSG